MCLSLDADLHVACNNAVVLKMITDMIALQIHQHCDSSWSNNMLMLMCINLYILVRVNIVWR